MTSEKLRFGTLEVRIKALAHAVLRRFVSRIGIIIVYVPCSLGFFKSKLSPEMYRRGPRSIPIASPLLSPGSQFRSFVKVEVAILASPSLIVLMVSVDQSSGAV